MGVYILVNNLMIDLNIKEALDLWISHGLNPGSCIELLLKGKYDEALKYAHPLIKPHWEDHIKYIKSLPIECRGSNMDKWKEKFNKSL